jgi:hypothetical protein
VTAGCRGTMNRPGEAIGQCGNLDRRELCALDNRAAILATVPDAGAAGTLQLFEVVMPVTEFLQAFRTTTLA